MTNKVAKIFEGIILAIIVGITIYICVSSIACNHSYVETIITPTCLEDGAYIYTCTKCGDSYSKRIPAEGHVFESSKAIYNKETGECDLEYTCTVCGYVYKISASY